MWVTKAAIKNDNKDDKKVSYKKEEVKINLIVAFSL